MSRLYLSNPCAFFHYPLHTAMRAQSAPGFPCALCQREGQRIGITRAKTRCENEIACLSVQLPYPALTAYGSGLPAKNACKFAITQSCIATCDSSV